MSLTPIGGRLFDGSGHKITTASLRDQKLRHEPITCLTAYDYAAARLVDEAGIDMVLVGDSLAQTMLGYENTLSVTMDEMLHHVKAVRRGVKNALLVADMPYGSYQIDAKTAVSNAARFVKEGGAEVVKIEGGEKRAELIRQIIDAEIPVAGHIGLTPQSVNVMGGYKVQGKSLSGIEQLMRDAVALDRAGVACLYLEGIPREVAAMITARGRHADDRNWRWSGVRRAGAGVSRHPEFDVWASGEICAALRRCGGADHACGAGVSGGRAVAPVSVGRGVVSPAEGNQGGAGYGAGAEAGDGAVTATSWPRIYTD